MIDSLLQLVNLKGQSSLIYLYFTNLEVLNLDVFDVVAPCAITLAPSSTLSNKIITSSLTIFLRCPRRNGTLTEHLNGKPMRV